MNNTPKLYSGTTHQTNAQRTRRACRTVIPLCFFSLFLSLFIVFSANDMYAFVKPEHTADIQLVGEHSAYEAAKVLERENIIKNPTLFYLYAASKDAKSYLVSAEGTLHFEATMSYRDILKVFAKNQPE